MELVPIIWNTLLLGAIFLLIVLLVSFVASKMKKSNEKVYDEFNLVPDRPVVITRRHVNPNIQVTSSKYEKVRARKDNQPRIFDISQDQYKSSKYTTHNHERPQRSTSTAPHYDGSFYGGSSKRNPRFTILNDTLNTSIESHKHLNVGNSYRFTETNFM